MAITAREWLAILLESGDASAAAPSVLIKARMADLRLTVDGIGPISFPVLPKQSRQLCELGQPAQFGRGEQTLTDPKVRDTWEIPKQLVHAEWGEVFPAILATVRDELGLRHRTELTAEFHSMLVYGRGQFFAPHQDSEKDDAMIGTLVVTLPSAHTGGQLVIEHAGQPLEYQGSRTELSLVAFYADCRHEILPVKSGYRITLTYNLLAAGGSGHELPDDEALLADLVQRLDQHFTTPAITRYGQAEPGLPSRLAYLLDHEYTARGLSWSRLKGADAGRVALLRAAAERAGCTAVLALAHVKETWNAYPERDGYGHRRNWDWDDGDEDEYVNDEGPYELDGLIESVITLTRWNGTDIALTIRDTEVCATTRSADLEPYASEYEGYMGNYGNTLDRWYHRAAVVVWPRGLDFANRAEASPAWALDELAARVRNDDMTEARAATATLAPFWNGASLSQAGLLGRALPVAGDLDDPQAARLLLQPFRIENVTVADMAPLARLAGQHGEQWTADLLRTWFGDPDRSRYSPERQSRPQWLISLPALCQALSGAGRPGALTARFLIEQSWEWLAVMLRGGLAIPSPTRRDTELDQLAPPLAAVLMAAAVSGMDGLRDEVIDFCRQRGDEVIPCELVTVQSAETVGAGALPVGSAAGFAELAADCAARLRARLARPPRATDDWSIELPVGCACELCGPLRTFLADPARRTFEWPLAEARRRHVHHRIDEAELPVTHKTRRQGRPYTLVLAKTPALFDRDRDARRRDEADLASLAGG
jgi:hypothetical protein